jgi:hypothetical protein
MRNIILNVNLRIFENLLKSVYFLPIESSDSHSRSRRHLTTRHNTNALNDQTIVHLQMRDTLSASDVRRTIRGLWQFDCASFFACFFCCINMYTISRFSVLTYFFKGKAVFLFFFSNFNIIIAFTQIYCIYSN